MDATSLLRSLVSVLFPEDISIHFEIKSVNEYSGRIEIKMEELAELVPDALYSKEEIVLDGFCNPIELQSFPLKGKAVYLKLYRRRWKEKGKKEHFSNSYDTHPDGVKATKEFASFLKESFGQSPNQYNRDIKSSMH